LERHAVSKWGDRDVHEITKRDVIDLLDGVAESGRGVTANRLRAYLKAFFNWCIDRDVIGANPVQGVKRPLKNEKSRDRVLSDDEIRWFWKACDQEGQPWGHMGKLLLLTGQRLGEVSGMTYGEVNGDLWSMASERTKNKRPHDVPLSSAALAVLRDVKRIKGKAGYVITTTGKTPVQSFDKPRKRLAALMEEIASEELGRKVDIPHWTFHDLRRTCATGMQRLGIPVRVTEAVLNHVSGTGGGIVGVYQRHDYAEEKREAINAWSEKIMELQAKS
jgi:integrase